MGQPPQPSNHSYDGGMTQGFDVVFVQDGKGWVAWVKQTFGPPVLPSERLEFKGKSLASVKERASEYLGALELTDWISSYDFAPILTPELARLLSAALDAGEEVEVAEYRKIRVSHRAIPACLQKASNPSSVPANAPV